MPRTVLEVLASQRGSSVILRGDIWGSVLLILMGILCSERNYHSTYHMQLIKKKKKNYYASDGAT